MHLPVRSAVGACARLLVVLLTLGTAVPLGAHADAGHDPCDSRGGRHAGELGIEAAAPDSMPRHCGVCHWLRSVRVFDVAVALPSTAAERGAHETAPALSSRAQQPERPAASRAPPA